MGQGGIRPGMVVTSGTTVSEVPMNGATHRASTGTLLLKFSNLQPASFFWPLPIWLFSTEYRPRIRNLADGSGSFPRRVIF